MGCDIHTIAEVKKDGKWITNKEPVFKNSWYTWLKENEKEIGEQKEYLEYPDRTRNYRFFALLANVRNYYDSTFIVPEERGWPKDMDYDSEEYMSNEHTPGFVTLAELEFADLNRAGIMHGIINLKQYKAVRKTGDWPDMWSGNISGRNVVKINTGQADLILDEGVTEVYPIKERTVSDLFLDLIYESAHEGEVVKEKDEVSDTLVDIKDKDVYVKYYWSYTLRESCGTMMDLWLTGMKKLLDMGYEDVRIVFDFDS